MTIKATCSHCNRPYLLKDELAGKRLRCKKCGKAFSVPDDDFDDYGAYDDYGADDADYDPPPMPRRRSSKKRAKSRRKRKTGMPVAAKAAIFGVAGVAVLGLMVWGAMAIPWSSLGLGKSYRSITYQIMGEMENLVEIIEGVEDLESAEAAAPKIEKIGDRLAAIEEENREWVKNNPITDEEKEDLQEEFRAIYLFSWS